MAARRKAARGVLETSPAFTTAETTGLERVDQGRALLLPARTNQGECEAFVRPGLWPDQPPAGAPAQFCSDCLKRIHNLISGAQSCLRFEIHLVLDDLEVVLVVRIDQTERPVDIFAAFIALRRGRTQLQQAGVF